jgi:uncharacterized YigZ family protein
MNQPYLTIADNHTFEQVIKKSRFICSLGRVSSEAEAKQFLATISQQHVKANHNCFAYLLGDHDEVQRESDNGEPSGTAGVPILQALQHTGVHDTIAVVTRYFGGIKLGTGGLIRAYNGTAAAAIHEVGLIQRILQDTVIIQVPYHLHDQQYGVDVTMTIFVNHDQRDVIISNLTNQFNNKLTIQIGDPRFNEVPYQPEN